MAMQRSEAIGLGVATAAHIALFAALSLAFADPAAQLRQAPMTVDLVTEEAPVSTAPEISAEEQAPALGTPDAAPPPPEPEPQPPEPEPAPPPPPPPPPPPKMQPRETPRPTPTPAPRRPEPRREPPRPERPREQARPERPREQARPQPPRTQAPARPRETPRPATPAPNRPRPNATPGPSGALDGIAQSVAQNTRGNRPNPPAAQSAAQVRQAISVSINAQVRSPWNGCRVTGVDVDRLRTTIVFRLAQTGALERIVSVETSGVNDSNRPQVPRFEECARRAIQLAAPFELPRENYSYWQTYTLDFEKR